MSALFSPDGQSLVIGSFNGMASIWDVRTGTLKGTPLQFGSSIQSMQFSPDSRFVVLTGEGKVSTFDVSTGKLLADPLFRGLFFNYRGMSTDGAIVVTSTASNILSRDDTIHVWQPETGDPLASHFLKKGPLGDVVLHPEGRIVYFVLEDQAGHSLHSWQISAGSSDDAETLARLAETTGGLRLDEDGRLVPLEDWTARINNLRSLPLDDSDDPTSAAALARWFFADRSTRTLSPLSQITVPDYIRHRLARGTDARDDVLKAYPDHPLVLEELRRAQSRPPSPPN